MKYCIILISLFFNYMTIYKLKIIKKNILQKYKKAFTISVSSLKKTLLFRPIMINQFQFRIQIIIYKIKFHEDEFLLLLGQYGIKMNRFLTKFISPCASSLHYSGQKRRTQLTLSTVGLWYKVTSCRSLPGQQWLS